MKIPLRFITTLSALLFIAADLPAASKRKVESLEDRSRDAYVWGYPAVLLAQARKTMLAHLPKGGNPINHFIHSRKTPEQFLTSFFEVNPENLYSWAWLDLSKEPLVMTQPPTPNRYYSVQFVDAYSNVFKVVSNKDFGDGDGHFVIIGPNWMGEVPPKATLIHAPTPEVFVLAQTFVGTPKALPQVLRLNRQRQLLPLSTWNQGWKKDSFSLVPPSEPPKFNKNLALGGVRFLEELMTLVEKNPPTTKTEDGFKENIKSLFNFAKTADQKRLEQGFFDAEREIQNRLATGTGPKINGWAYELKSPPFTTDYLLRAAVSQESLFSPPPEEFLQMSLGVDSESRQLSSNYRYVLHFEQGDLPPSQTMWSVRVQEMSGALMAFTNEKSSKFKYNMDGSLDLLIQTEEPRNTYRPNWIPLKRNVHFQVVLTLFTPNNLALSYKYIAPSLTRLDESGIPKQRMTQTMMAQTPRRVSK